MLKRKKPKLLQKRRLLDISASRRRIKRNIAVLKLHRHRRNYQSFFNLFDNQAAEQTPV